MSIIIVGNGTSIKDNQDGKKIDGFDTVLRFNSFKIKGYEQPANIIKYGINDCELMP